MPRLGLLALAAALVVPAAGAVQVEAATPRAEAPDAADLVRGAVAVPHTTLTADGVLRVLGMADWGGKIRVPSGETVTVLFSRTYPEDPAVAQQWADFLGGLVHGPELSRLTAYFAPASEVARICGGDGALACYSPQEELLVAPGEDPDVDVSAESVVLHEYGHHIARNRSNAPWSALDYGTKRWASAMNICARTEDGELFPDAQSLPRYRLNPGEGFAESYRLLNERRTGIPETPWVVVSERLYPREQALAALERDVADPWTGTTTTSHRGRHTRPQQTRTVSVSTPLDGRLSATVRAPRGARLQVDVLAAGRRVARVRTPAGGTRRVSTTVCGQRTHRFVVRALTGTGAFRLDVAKP